MAEGAEAATSSEGGGGLKKALTKKIGPLPLVAWIGIAIVVFYYVSKRQSGGAAGGPQTDPAGNVGTINPQTGYVYGSPEDQAQLGSGSGSIGSSADEGTGGSTVAGQYPDNNAWAVAAINYLVSIGVDATAANTAVTQFLASQQLTTDQQAQINLVIQRIGAPPSPPEPGGNNPPIVNPPTSSTYATNPPSGLTTTVITAGTIGLKWNAATNATSYVVSWGTTSAATDGSQTVSTTATNISNLKAGTLYYVRVQAQPAKPGAAAATLTQSTHKLTVQTPPPSDGHSITRPSIPAKSSSSSSRHRTETITSAHPNLSSLVAAYNKQYGTHFTWQQIWEYNLEHRPADTVKTLKARGPNSTFHGSTFWFPY